MADKNNALFLDRIELIFWIAVPYGAVFWVHDKNGVDNTVF